jgi:hypothetical protein
MGQSHGHLPFLPKSKRRMSWWWHLQFFLFKQLWFKLPSHIHFLCMDFYPSLSLSLCICLFMFSIMKWTPLCWGAYVPFCVSQGVEHHCVKVHEKKQVQGQVEPKRFKLSQNHFFTLSPCSLQGKECHLLKILFFFSIIFSLFMIHARNQIYVYILSMHFFLLQKKVNTITRNKMILSLLCFLYLFFFFDKCVFIFYSWKKKKISIFVYVLCLIII